MAAAHMNDPVSLQLTVDESLVLFEMLSRFSDLDSLSIEDPAESSALLRLLAQLETQLVQPFAPDYSVLLKASRQRLRDKFG